MITDAELDDIKTKCLAATRGKWEVTNYDGCVHIWLMNSRGNVKAMVADNHTPEAIIRVRGVGFGLPVDANAQHIAACSPDVVLALVEELQHLRALR